VSGYLHRLAASARSPGGGIHPLLRPMFSSAVPEVVEEERSETFIPSAPETPRRSQPHEIPLPAPFRTAEPEAPAAETPQHEIPKPRPVDRPRPWAQRPGRLVASLQDELQLERPAFAARTDDSLRAFPAVGERPPLFATTTHARGETATRASRRTSSEPDDVHIHIGRIEVTAVQAAPPQPPKPRRAATSLAEYLQRRNGRAS